MVDSQCQHSVANKRNFKTTMKHCFVAVGKFFCVRELVVLVDLRTKVSWQNGLRLGRCFELPRNWGWEATAAATWVPVSSENQVTGHS